MPKIVGFGGKEYGESSPTDPSKASIGSALAGLATRGIARGVKFARKVGRKIERRETLAPPRNILGRRG